MKKFPFITFKQSLALLRVSVAGIFLAHAIVRIAGGTVRRFGGYLENKGFIFGNAVVWGITAYEIIGGLLLAAGYFIKWLSAGFILLLLIGVVLIHATQGWFVGEHGSGGMEYSFILIIALIVIAASDRKRSY
jgi:putative oxidoreductase